MRIWAVILAVLLAAGPISVLPAKAAAGLEAKPEPAELIVSGAIRHQNAPFAQFFEEFSRMLDNWWGNGGRQASSGQWYVSAAEVLRPGNKAPHFVVIVRSIGRGPRVVLTFSVPPFAQTNLFMAAYYAFSAAVRAILGEMKGDLEWKGMGGNETVRRNGPFPVFAGAAPVWGGLFLLTGGRAKMNLWTIIKKLSVF